MSGSRANCQRPPGESRHSAPHPPSLAFARASCPLLHHRLRPAIELPRLRSSRASLYREEKPALDYTPSCISLHRRFALLRLAFVLKLAHDSARVSTHPLDLSHSE